MSPLFMHFTWLSNFFSSFAHGADIEKFVLAILLGALLIFLGKRAVFNIKVLPQNDGKLATFFDVLFEKFVAYQDSLIGKENRHHAGLTFSVFLFVLISNLIGLIPGVAAITTTVWVNVGVALVVFAAFNYYGFKAHGVKGYLAHFCGPVAFVAPAVFCLELLSTCLRILTLNLRLYWNITSDHLVLEVFTELTKIGVPVVFYALGTFVSFMQAFVFTTLTMVYIMLATQHEEAH